MLLVVQLTCVCRYCVSCINQCHKLPQFSSHRVDDFVRKEEAYCTCGCSAECISMPGREAKAAAALAAVKAGSEPVKIGGLTCKAATEWDPAFVVDLSADRSVTTEQREHILSYNGWAKRFNEHWRTFLADNESLTKKNITRYAVMQSINSALNTCFDCGEQMVRIGGLFAVRIHSI